MLHVTRALGRSSRGEVAVSAILREIGIIGEALNALPVDVTTKRPEIAWRQIGAMRNFLIHEYFNIDEAAAEDVISTKSENGTAVQNQLHRECQSLVGLSGLGA